MNAIVTPAAAPPRAGDKTLEWVKAIGMPLVTLLVTVLGGYHLGNLAKEREGRESSQRLYAQLLTHREQSDALIRKDMFSVVIAKFLVDRDTGSLRDKVLQLELLANNFNQTFDLAPLFKDLAQRLDEDGQLERERAAALRRRLDVSAASVILKQTDALARRGFSKGVMQQLGEWEKQVGKPVIDVTLTLLPQPVRVRIEIVDVNLARREIEVRIRADLPGDDSRSVDRHFWVSPYDFPMLDNTQLPNGLRASVVMTEFFVPDAPSPEREANSFVNLNLVVFPAASASFKERQDYDDVLLDMLRASHPPAERQEARP